jgi:hypothetical protein
MFPWRIVGPRRGIHCRMKFVMTSFVITRVTCMCTKWPGFRCGRTSAMTRSKSTRAAVTAEQTSLACLRGDGGGSGGSRHSRVRSSSQIDARLSTSRCLRPAFARGTRTASFLLRMSPTTQSASSAHDDSGGGTAPPRDRAVQLYGVFFCIQHSTSAPGSFRSWNGTDVSELCLGVATTGSAASVGASSHASLSRRQVCLPVGIVAFVLHRRERGKNIVACVCISTRAARFGASTCYLWTLIRNSSY